MNTETIVIPGYRFPEAFSISWLLKNLTEGVSYTSGLSISKIIQNKVGSLVYSSYLYDESKLKNMYYSETTVSNLINVLDENVTRFQFKKMDGTIRTALGTRNEILIPKEECIKMIDDISPKSVVFWDLEEKAFRSFSKNAEVAVL